MPDVQIIQAISSIASSISTVGVLVWWIMLERKRSDALLQLVSDDWKRQREEEIERRVEERYQMKVAKVPNGSGL